MTCKPTDFTCRPTPQYLCNFAELAAAIASAMASSEVAQDIELVQSCIKAETSGTGFSIGDIVYRNLFYDTTPPTPPTLVATAYYNATTGSEVLEADVLAGTFVACSVDYETTTTCFIDSNTNKFFRTFWLDPINQTVIGFTDYDEVGASFTPVGNIVKCDSDLTITETVHYQVITASTSWSIPANTSSVTITVIDATDSPIITTNSGAGVALFTGQTISFNADHGNLDGTLTVDTGAGSVVAINWIQETY